MARNLMGGGSNAIEIAEKMNKAAEAGPAAKASSTTATAETTLPVTPQALDLSKSGFSRSTPQSGGPAQGGAQPPPFDGGAAFNRNYSAAMGKLSPQLGEALAGAVKDLPKELLAQMADGAVSAFKEKDPSLHLLEVFIPAPGTDGGTETTTSAYMYTSPGEDTGTGDIPPDGGTPPADGPTAEDDGVATGQSGDGSGVPGGDGGGGGGGNGIPGGGGGGGGGGGPDALDGNTATGNSGVGGGVPNSYDGGTATGNSGAGGGWSAPSGGVSSSAWNSLSGLGLGDADLEAVAFIVLMQATSDMDKDLKMVMAEVKSMTAAKAKLRELISQVNKDVAKNATQKKNDEGQYTGKLEFDGGGLGSPEAYLNAKVPVPNPESQQGFDMVETELMGTAPVNVDELKAIQQNLKEKLDSMNEVSEMTSLRLQMIMDRRAKMISTLTNVMKKISTTQDNVVANLK
jgi:hypothetical protein